MARSKRSDEVAEALIQGIRDHGPMTTSEAIAFLAGFGIDLDPQTAPQYIRQAVYYHKDRIRGIRMKGEVKYHLA